MISSVTAYECNNAFDEFGKENSDTHSLNSEKINPNNKNIFNFLDKLHDHTKVIFTCLVRSYGFSLII